VVGINTVCASEQCYVGAYITHVGKIVNSIRMGSIPSSLGIGTADGTIYNITSRPDIRCLQLHLGVL
jgi:hypothetical protein